MTKCNLCSAEFINNLGGQLTHHVKAAHGLSLEDYVVRSELRGAEPRCACGLCNERPLFRRGVFERYALNHNRFDERERRWRERHGEPRCELCNTVTRFRRAVPDKRCKGCSMVGKGFDDPATQEKIRDTVKERYDVDNVSQAAHVRKRISAALMGQPGHVDSTETRQKKSEASKRMWQRPGQRQRLANAIGEATRRPAVRAKRSKQMTQQMLDPSFKERAFANHKNRLTKLHQRLRIELGLDVLGFASEQRVGRYFVDELHSTSKVIVEVFGDHPHANPKRFKPDDVVRLRGQSFTASSKWSADAARTKCLEDDGYKVIVCWESDDIDEVKRRITDVLG